MLGPRPRDGHAVFLGFCGLKYLEDLGVVDLGYRFLPQYWGRGLATEAGKVCLNFAFDTLSLSDVDAFVLPENARSIGVLKKLGMTFVETLVMDGQPAQRWRITSQAKTTDA